MNGKSANEASIRYENFYTIGMRGIHDSGMEGVKTLQEKTDALQQVINDQRTLLSKYVKKDVAKIPQAFVPYKEVLQIMENGLQVPDDITLIWCDDNYGRNSKNAAEVPVYIIISAIGDVRMTICGYALPNRGWSIVK